MACHVINLDKPLNKIVTTTFRNLHFNFVSRIS